MIKMIAAKTLYDRAARKEYKVGAEFEASDDYEAARLERTRKAVRKSFVVPAMVDLPKTEAPGEPKRRGRPPKYLRRDMTATDGPTGEEVLLPSSLQETQPEEPISDNSEAEQES